MLAMNGGAPALERRERLRSSPGLIASNTLLLATGFIFQTYLAPAEAQHTLLLRTARLYIGKAMHPSNGVSKICCAA
jgi:hypothetical protein